MWGGSWSASQGHLMLRWDSALAATGRSSAGAGATRRPWDTGASSSSGAWTARVRRAMGAPSGTLTSGTRPGMRACVNRRRAALALQARTRRSVVTLTPGPLGTGSAPGVGPGLVGPHSRVHPEAARLSENAPVRVRTVPPASSMAAFSASTRTNMPPSTQASGVRRDPAAARRAATAAARDPWRAVSARRPGATASVASTEGSAV